MARSSIETHCKRLGLDVGRLDRPGVERLLHHLALGLNIFIGREKSEHVIGEIRLALEKVKL
jgi:hypothetical protein